MTEDEYSADMLFAFSNIGGDDGAARESYTVVSSHRFPPCKPTISSMVIMQMFDKVELVVSTAKKD